jgi:hypothetical protein
MSSVFRINNYPDFENVGVHVYYIGGRIKGLKIGETPPKSWLLASLQFSEGIKSLIKF